MFYSQFILAKKGPLGTIWIAAHLERKLRKNQVADTDIGVSVDSILSPDVPIALRLSSHLLLGVVRIYNKKVNYLFDDCSEALLKIKQAFRSTTVDLPPEESKAPYHSITLPETFDLDDFELPDSDIFQGNYVDHHISSKEQITLQDNMEGVSYSSSKFGLDERFGDGDASGLDLDEELLLDKVGSAGDADERADPHTSFVLISPIKQDEDPEDGAANSETRVDDDGESVDLMDYAQAPSTPGLVEQPNMSNVRDASACEDHLESEDHLMASAAKENTNDVPYEEKQEVRWCSQDDVIPDIVHPGPSQEIEHASDGLEIEDSKPEGESLIGAHVLTENKIIKESDVPCQEDSQIEAVKDETKDDNQGPNEIGLDKSALEISGLVDSSGKQTSEGLAVEDVAPLVVDAPQGVGEYSGQQKSHNDDVVLGLEEQVGSFKEKSEVQAGEETICGSNLDAHDKEVASEALVLRPCNSEHPAVTKPVSSMATDVESDVPLTNFGREDASLQGQASSVTGNSEQTLKENQVEEHPSGEEILVSATEANDQLHNMNSQDKLENLDNSTQLDLPAPEKLLSVPEGHVDLHGDALAEVSPRDFGELAEGDAGSKTVAGRKRSLTESTLTEQSLNSVESSRQVRAKRTVESVPDDDDLLSSILVGRRSSVLKVKPTPLSEVTSVKRNRTAPRSGPPKRKVLMDDTMVLHGDTIRKQLTNTEDIRRVRKKAPCTFPEISMIQKQHMEDEIFLQPCFTGVSVELVSLHSQVYDLSQIRVCQNDALDASLEIMTKLGQPSQNDETGALETKAEPNSTFCNDKQDTSPEALAELHLPSPNKENHDIEADKGTEVVEESVQGLNTEPYILRDNEMAEPNLNPLPTQNMVADDNNSEEVNINQEQSKPSSGAGQDGLQLELSENVATEEENPINDGSKNPALVAEIEPLDFTGHVIDDTVDASAVPDQRTEVNSVELDYVVVDEGQSITRTEVLDKDGDANGEAEVLLTPNNDILPDAAAAATAVDLAQDAIHGELEYNVPNENYNFTYEEQREVGFSYPAAPIGLEDSLLNHGERIDNPEVYHPNMADAEISGFDMRDQDELNYSTAANDTEFLNVDDDELTEMADDYIPDAEEKQYTENSGWSSRTRAVSKYLQTAFTKEAECGGNSLSLDNLLAGKSRKEASRMFFETLVLKTRDYIEVEQQKPFNDIIIKPQTRLMKSDF